MKNVLILMIVLLVSIVACKKEKVSCYQSDITLTYDTYSQYDSTYTLAKRCLTETQWETLTFEDNYNPNTGQVIKRNEVGTTSARYYNADRADSVTQTIRNYEVDE